MFTEESFKSMTTKSTTMTFRGISDIAAKLEEEIKKFPFKYSPPYYRVTGTGNGNINIIELSAPEAPCIVHIKKLEGKELADWVANKYGTIC